jgi:hypothetical protein
MSIIVIPGGKRTRQPQGAVRIDWGNPFTRGLVFCAVPIGNTFIDLVTGVIGTPSGTTTASIRGVNGGLSRRGEGVSTSGASGFPNYVLWPISTDRGATMGQSATILALGGTNTQIDNYIYRFGGNVDNIASGDGYSLGIDSFRTLGRGNIIKSRYASSDVSSTQLLGTTFGNKTHFFGYSATSNGASGNWFAGGSATAYTGAAVAHGTTTTNRRAFVIGSGDVSGDNTHDTYASLVLFFDRAIAPIEYAALYDNPWQLFAPSRRVVVFGAAAGGPTAYPLTASPATATLTGTGATFVYTPASTAYPLTASAGTATFAGSAATFSWGRAVTASAGTAALAGSAATFSKGYQVTASAGTLTATGAAATFAFTGLVKYALTAEPAVVTVTGTSATFAYTGALVYTLTASPGSMTLTGRAATVGIPSASIWTDVGVSASTWSDVGPATSIWTDI